MEDEMIEKLKELMKLVEENPELEIVTMVYNEIVCEDWGYWKSKIGEIKKNVIWEDDERIHFGEDILEELFDRMALVDDESSDENLRVEVENKYEQLKQLGKIKEAIIIYIEVP